MEDHEKFQVQTEDLSRLEQQFEVDLRPMTGEERKQRFGVTESRNEVKLVMDSENNPVIIKNYKKLDALGPTNEDRATNELSVINKLQREGFAAAPRLKSEKIAHNEKGEPAIAFVYEEQYTPLSAIKPLLLDELGSDNPRSHYLHDAFMQTKALHETAVHNDLHLDNIGLVPPGVRSEQIEFVMLDFELAQPVDQMSDRARFYAKTGDIVNMSAHTLFNVTNASSYSEVPDKYKQSLSKIVSESYFQGQQDVSPQYLEAQMEIRYEEIARRLSK